MFSNSNSSSFFQLFPSPYRPSRPSRPRSLKPPWSFPTFSFLLSSRSSRMMCRLSSTSSYFIILSMRRKLLRQASLASMVFLTTA
jgi:hypothetical protein